MNIYVFNLHAGMVDQELRQLLFPFDEGQSAHVVTDVILGGSRGFGRAEIEDVKAAQNAINHFNETEPERLTIYVNETKAVGDTAMTAGHHFNPIGFNKN